MILKTILINTVALLVLLTFTQCATSKKIEDIAPVKIENPYFETWNSENENGLTIYIPVEETTTLILEHAYFRQKKITLTKEEGQSVYIGKYTYPKGSKDLVMSSDPKEEYGNELPVGIERIPFRIKDNECVISYTKEGVKGHFKINNIPKKKS
ncbi:hypothetical protein [Aquimarina sp. AU474]|uniref:hypothetical protein n=1 Tax=Aquimarina sp. AU474 TaxID=2108529 RepID=UPI000D695B61|nr:hypothetical protein [Aquimarina sp. AU474]